MLIMFVANNNKSNKLAPCLHLASILRSSYKRSTLLLVLKEKSILRSSYKRSTLLLVLKENESPPPVRGGGSSRSYGLESFGQLLRLLAHR